jgi:hypothetical protein
MLFCFTTIYAEILHHINGYNLCTECRILVQICQMLLPSKASNDFCIKAALLWCQQFWYN